MFTIYLIKNTVNDKCYVGKTSKTTAARWQEHINESGRKSNRHLYNAIRKYGISAFTIREIDTAQTEAEANALENAYICLYMTDDSTLGYNLTLGGDGVLGWKHTDETKRKISQSLIGNKYSLGHHPSEATRQKLRETRRGRQPALGKTPTEETRCKLSQALMGNQNGLGYRHSDEARLKISQSLIGNKYGVGNKNCLGRVVSGETRRKMREARLAYYAKKRALVEKELVASSELGRQDAELPASLGTPSSCTASFSSATAE